MLEDISAFIVNEDYCKSCPFKPDENGIWQDNGIATKVIERTLFKCQQLCHGTRDKTICRGARNYHLEIYYRLGIISAPTDEAWDEAVRNNAQIRFKMRTK